MRVEYLDTPALLLDSERVIENSLAMSSYARKSKVVLRPHSKTHKMPEVAHLQIKHGAVGIAVAKVGEAEVMAECGIENIFIANEIVGKKKIQRIIRLAKDITITFGVDSLEQLAMIEEVCAENNAILDVLVEIEVGEQRSGVVNESDFKKLLTFARTCYHVNIVGVFSHDGHSYAASNLDELKRIHMDSQLKTLRFVDIARQMGVDISIVSIGSTPSLLHDFEIIDGITEIRPGTYIFMDSSQSNSYGSSELCAATVLATVMSKPTLDRVVLDVGAKGLTAQTRSKGMCTTIGLGKIKGYDDVFINNVFDEHAIVYSRHFSSSVSIGDKVEIIPNHICPVVNLYDEANWVNNGFVMKAVEIKCRGKLK